MPVSEPGRRASSSSVQEKPPTLMPVAISEEDDAAVPESFCTETCPTGSSARSAMGECMFPAEEQSDGHQVVVVAKGGLKGQVFPVEVSCQGMREGLGRL